MNMRWQLKLKGYVYVDAVKFFSVVLNDGIRSLNGEIDASRLYGFSSYKFYHYLATSLNLHVRL